MKRVKSLFLGVGLLGMIGACGNNTSNTLPPTTGAAADTTSGVGTSSEVSTSAVSGAMNQSAGSAVAMNQLMRVKEPTIQRVWNALKPIAAAWAFPIEKCLPKAGGALSPAFDGSANDPYTFTPASCTVDFPKLGKTVSEVWSSTFTLSYNSSCDDKNPMMENQTGNGCALTRTTTATAGNTRTITGIDGNSYAVTHNTNGAGTEWEVQTGAPAAPPSFSATDITDGGLVRTCTSVSGGTCASGQTLVINGSNLVAVETLKSSGESKTIWNHTIYTLSPGLSITNSGSGRVVNGQVVTEHNLAKFEAMTSFDNVEYSDANCCFPTSGTASTTFNSNGPNNGKTESIQFGTDADTCGSATLTKTDGTHESITLQHCL